MYFIALSILLIISYIILTYFFQLFFNGKIWKAKLSILHIWTIVLFLFFTIFIVFKIPNPELANRFQHAIWGGFLMIILVYFSYRASNISLSKFQFFCISLMIATCFWVANELAESLLQWNNLFIFADILDDTWLDLWANTLWALLWAGIFSIFLKK